MQSDTQLVQAASKGDQTAFASLVEKYKKAVYGVILPKVRDFHQAQDLASETFVQAYLSLESLKAPEKVGFWLCGIARNVTGKWLARQKRDDWSLEQLLEERPWSESEMRLFPFETTEHPDEIVERTQMNQLLWRCLYALPEISQEILILFYMREMKQAEIAEFLGISLTAVRNRLSDARKRLKKEMICMVENTVQNQPLAENFTEQVIAEAMKHGEQHLADGRWKEAREQFQRAADIQGDYAPAYRGLGLARKGMFDAQLDQPHEPVDRQLLEEACAELARAYRLGARDAGTVWTLADLYHQFQRCHEYADLLWDFAMTSSETKEAFRAGWKSTHEMQRNRVADYERALRCHAELVEKFAGRVDPIDELWAYVVVQRAYRKMGRIDDWFAHTAHLVEQIGDEMLLEPYYHYMRDRAFELRHMGRHREAIAVAEAFIRWARDSKRPNPRTKWMTSDVLALVLLRAYHEIGDPQKLEEVLTHAEEILFQYPDEWEATMASITDESEATRERLEALYHQVVFYPDGATTVSEIREWLYQLYDFSIGAAGEIFGDICGRIGKGETAIDLLIPFSVPFETIFCSRNL